ncbi:MAG TPA: 50S ribosomal protein L7ae-like protein [Veillonellaceae bacterium]|nr:50S ribosomal protein L7ae-like protein [Veillonellaceae bacterium]
MTLEEIKKSVFVVGMKETERALEKGTAAVVLIASDCDGKIADPLRERCAEAGIPVEQSFTKKELGKACGIKVKAAAAAVLKTR